jgi:hypothetical protein
MENKLNLKILSAAIAEHTKPDQISYQDESTIALRGVKIRFNGNMAQTERFSFRFDNPKGLLVELYKNGLLNCSANTIFHILNRYRHLMK